MSRQSITGADPLARIAAPERPSIPLKTFVIVARPHDETLACGALLPRLADVTVQHATDGASRDLVDHAGQFASLARAAQGELGLDRLNG